MKFKREILLDILSLLPPHLSDIKGKLSIVSQLANSQIEGNAPERYKYTPNEGIVQSIRAHLSSVRRQLDAEDPNPLEADILKKVERLSKPAKEIFAGRRECDASGE